MQHLEKLKPLAQLVLRLGLAIIFFYHGYPKLAHRQQWFAAFPKMGFPWYFAYIAGTLETVGSCLLAVGLLTRLVALLLAGEMAIALYQVHMAKGLLAVYFYQLPLALAIGAFALMTIGGGPVSLDRLIFRDSA